MKRKHDGYEDLSSWPLLDLILCKKWGEVRERIGTEEWKNELRRKNSSGEVLLSIACLYDPPCDLVGMMLEEYPAAARVTNNCGDLPLHWACSSSCISPRVMRLLLDAYPEGAKTAGDNGRLPLHRLFSHLPLNGLHRHDEHLLEICKMIVDAHPQGVKVADNYGSLPLHEAACDGYPLELLTILVKAHPEGATTRCRVEGYLPLHRFDEYGCGGDDGDDTRNKVKLLLEPILSDEEACQVTNTEGETPLGIAVKYNVLSLHTCVSIESCSPNVIIWVARHRPLQLCTRDKGGNLPLHAAAANHNLNGARVASRGLRLNENSNDRDDGDDDGDEASDDESEVEHQEASNGEGGACDDDAEVSEDLIGALVKLDPRRAGVWNRDERFPLVLAIESGKRWDEGVEALAEAAKDACLMKDESSNLYPFMLAATVDNPCLTTVYKMLRLCPELKRYIIK